MTPNKLPPLPDSSHVSPTYVHYYTADQMHAYAAEALRHSQSLPTGAVAGLAELWERSASLILGSDAASHATRNTLAMCAQHVREREALQADAREKGEAVFRLYPEELARMTHGPSLRAEEEDRLRSIYGDVAIPLYLHSGDYTEAMLLLEKQRELVENLRGQLDDAKADATDGCTEANCERCNTAIHSRGDMRHAGIGTYPATQPAQASEKINASAHISAIDYAAQKLLDHGYPTASAALSKAAEYIRSPNRRA